MALAINTEWNCKSQLKKGSATRMRHARTSQPEDDTLDYRRVIAAYPQALQIGWRNFREHTYDIVKDRKNEYCIDAADSLPRPLQLSEEEILKGVESIYTSQRDSSQHIPGIRISRLEHFETYYRDMSNMYRGRPQLPVWQITVDDPDRSAKYIHPETGIIRHVDTPSP